MKNKHILTFCQTNLGRANSRLLAVYRKAYSFLAYHRISNLKGVLGAYWMYRKGYGNKFFGDGRWRTNGSEMSAAEVVRMMKAEMVRTRRAQVVKTRRAEMVRTRRAEVM